MRAFGTQLLCEQVIGRALRRQSYELNEENKFNVEYADILGIPFDFTAKPTIVSPKPPRKTNNIKAISPERDQLELTFPRIEGYRVELPQANIRAEFTEDSILELTPKLVGPSVTRNQGIIGEGVDLNLKHLNDVRHSKVIKHLAKRLIYTKWREPNTEVKIHLFNQFRRITKKWINNYLVCKGGTYPAQLMYQELADLACERITIAIVRAETQAEDADTKKIRAILNTYNSSGSTMHVNFNTSKQTIWKTDSRKCHINYVVCDSNWEAEFCRVAESHPKVKSYVKNHNLGLEVPYRYGNTNRIYLPDFIVQVDDGKPDPLNLIVEIKGYRGEDAKDKKLTIENYWLHAINNLKSYGRWAFAEFRDVYLIESEFENMFNEIIAQASEGETGK